MNEKLLTERAERLNKILKEKGAGFHVEYMNVYKNNVYMDAYALRKEESDAAPIIYFDMEWWEKSDAQVVDFLISMNRNDYDIDTWEQCLFPIKWFLTIVVFFLIFILLQVYL